MLPTVEVLFGGVRGTRVSVVAPDRLFVIAPPSPLPVVEPDFGEGSVDVTVRNLSASGVPHYGESATLLNGYRYQRVQLGRESDYGRVTRSLVLEMQKQVIANVSIGQDTDFDMDVSDMLNVVDVADLPAVVLFGPTLQENRFYSISGRTYSPLQVHEADAHNAPDTDDLVYSFVCITDQKQEALSLQAVMRSFFMNNRWLTVQRDPLNPALGFVEYDLYYDGTGGMPWLPPPDQKSSLRSFSGTFSVRGFNFEALTGFPLSNRVERTHQVLEDDHEGPLVPEPPPGPSTIPPPDPSASTKSIVAFSFPDGVGVIGNDGTISVSVPYGTDVTRLIPTITHNGASVSPASGNEADFTSPVTYTVTAADGSTQQYEVTVTVRAQEGTSTMKIGTNFWYLTAPSDPWSGEYAIVPGVNWATAYGAGTDGLANTNIWNPVWLEQLEPYACLRFMDWGNVNWSQLTTWSQRRLPTADNYEAYIDGGSTPPNPGLAYEWMIDLCNRTDKDMWVCIPAQADANFSVQLATLIHSKLKPSLRVYVEYSNETWNGTFGQFEYVNQQGVAQNLPGMNQYYQGQAYTFWRSLQIFEAFEGVFGNAAMGTRVIRVFAFGGNLDTGREAIATCYASNVWNPDNQVVDMLALAPYVGGELDGASPTIAAQFHADILAVESDRIGYAVQVKNDFNIEQLGCYEGGQHLLANSMAWSANPLIYDEYRFMLSRWAPYFTLFVHYTHTGQWTNDPGRSSWGALDNTNQSIAQAHKYRAIVEWLIANP